MTRDSEGQMRKARLRALDVLAAPLAGHGLRKARKKGLFFEPRDDGAFLVVAIASARSEHPRVASAVAVHAGLGLAPEVGDLRVTNVHPLPFVLGSAPPARRCAWFTKRLLQGGGRSGMTRLGWRRCSVGTFATTGATRRTGCGFERSGISSDGPRDSTRCCRAPSNGSAAPGSTGVDLRS